MAFSTMNLWKFSFFKNLKGLFSSSQRQITCVLISETGFVSKTFMLLATGYAGDPNAKMNWLVINRLMLTMEGVEGRVLIISERSYIPMDPLERLDAKERASIVSLKDLATSKWQEARSQVAAEMNKSVNAETIKTIMYLFGLLIVIGFIVYLFKK